MATLRIVEPVYEYNDGTEHKEHQEINTRVSHYMRLYATGKINEFPTNGLIQNKELPEELRNDLLNRNLPLPELGTDPVEIMAYLTEHREEYESLVDDFSLCVKDTEKYNAAMEVIDDSNSTDAEVAEAIRVIEAIKAKARARSV